MICVIKTIDAHVGGEALRLIVDGFPRPHGRTLVTRREWLKRHADTLRRSIVLPPRGHGDLTAAVLTEATSPTAHAGVLLMDASGYPAMSGHGIVAATTIALERAIIFSRDFDQGAARLIFDTPAGTVAANAAIVVHGDVSRVDRVTVTNVPAFVHAASEVVKVGNRQLRVDVAFGGELYAIVDTEATGIPLSAARLPDLRRLGVEICTALNASGVREHPVDVALSGVGGVIFTGPPEDPEAHLRNVTIGSAGAIDVSGSITGTSAAMAVLDAMGLLPDGQSFVHEGLSGSLLRGRIVGRTAVGEATAIVTEIVAAAWITGEHTFFVDEDDPFREGVKF